MSTPPSGPPPVPNPNPPGGPKTPAAAKQKPTIPAPKGDDGPVLDDESLKRWNQFGCRLGAL